LSGWHPRTKDKYCDGWKVDDKHWETIAKMYQCPECGWVTECYPNCPIKEENK